MVTGGSQGARAISAAVSGAAAALRRAGVQVLHITGPQHVLEVPDGNPGDPPYVVVPYVEEMQYAYAAADFAICRSGAMTCAELAAVGLPAAYVPLPLRGGEQRLNAEPAVVAGGALVTDDAGLDPAWIEATLIPVLTDPGRIAAMSARASAAAQPTRMSSWPGTCSPRSPSDAGSPHEDHGRPLIVTGRRAVARRVAAP